MNQVFEAILSDAVILLMLFLTSMQSKGNGEIIRNEGHQEGVTLSTHIIILGELPYNLM